MKSQKKHNKKTKKALSVQMTNNILQSATSKPVDVHIHTYVWVYILRTCVCMYKHAFSTAHKLLLRGIIMSTRNILHHDLRYRAA